jgi:succinoglycan biosynthesis transport protein ExoP
MSRNFELLQRSAADVSGVSEREIQQLLTDEPRVAAEEKSQTQPVLSFDQMAKEEIAKLVQTVFHAHQESPRRAVLFAAINSGSGCTWISTRSAEILSTSVSEPVCLVDANFRTPSRRGVLGPTNQYGLADALRTQRPIREFVRQIDTRNLWLLPSGTGAEAAASSLGSDRMKTLLGELRKEFGYVVIDGPPLSAYADSLGLGHVVDGIVLVLEANVTRREVGLQVTERLRSMNLKVLGAVLNKRTFPIPNFLYHLI